MSPVVSICIPTYNRAIYLDKSLESIVMTRIFKETDDIEIVVSDNASTDDTAIIVNKYQSLFPYKIKYHRNKDNVRDKNFEIVLSEANGKFRKLSNDYVLYSEKCLKDIVDIVKENIIDKPLIFFTNASLDKDVIVCRTHSLKDFLFTVSYISTWIGGFGIWQHQLKYLKKYSEYYLTQLIQVKLIFSILSETHECLIVNKTLFSIIPVKNKVSCDVLKVMGFNYINIIQEYANFIPEANIELEKKRILYRFIIPAYCNFSKQCIRADSYGYRNLYKTYRKNWYFYFLPVYIVLYFIYYKVRRIIPPLLRSKIRSLVVK